eukprot:scaffold12808_cov76-Skeletonema_dohrnii-CCMP3373.AAC.2
MQIVMCIQWICCMTRAKYSRLTSRSRMSICESSLLVNIAYCIGVEFKAGVCHFKSKTLIRSSQVRLLHFENSPLLCRDFHFHS